MVKMSKISDDIKNIIEKDPAAKGWLDVLLFYPWSIKTLLPTVAPGCISTPVNSLAKLEKNLPNHLNLSVIQNQFATL